MIYRPTNPAAISAAELPTLPDIAYAFVREQILTGALPMDAPLRQERIARELGISRLPVREALTRLESEGLVVFRPRKGFTVGSLDPSEIKEVFDVRMVLEEHAVRLATEMRNSSDLAEVEALVTKMNGIEPTSSEAITSFSTYNRMFHERIAIITANKRLCALLGTLHDNAERLTRMGARLVSDLHYAHQEHKLIFDAFAAGDAEAAAKHSRDHVRQTGDRLIAALQKNSVISG